MPANRKISGQQMEMLVEWMVSHPLQARGAMTNSLQGKQHAQRLWEELASRLNAVGDGTTKKAKDWRQYWSDMKCKVKKKGVAMRQHTSGTGRRPSWNGILTPLEDRILSLMEVQNVSPHQFNTMVNFMEQYGDLNKQSGNPKEKILILQRWDELTSLLNNDDSGIPKSVDIWKKVWSDFKCKTKIKADEFRKEASNTSGGPATSTKISNMEQRVLKMMGIQYAGSDDLVSLPSEKEDIDYDSDSSIQNTIHDPLSIDHVIKRQRISESDSESMNNQNFRKKKPQIVSRESQTEQTGLDNVKVDDVKTSSSQNNGFDEYDYFGLMLAAKIRKMNDAFDRESVMNSIHNLVFQKVTGSKTIFVKMHAKQI